MKLNWLLVSRITIIALFLALIRSIMECLRLEYVNPTTISYTMVKPYIVASAITAIMCLVSVIISFFNKPKIVVLVVLSTIAFLLVYKVVVIH